MIVSPLQGWSLGWIYPGFRCAPPWAKIVPPLCGWFGCAVLETGARMEPQMLPPGGPRRTVGCRRSLIGDGALGDSYLVLGKRGWLPERPGQYQVAVPGGLAGDSRKNALNREGTAVVHAG